MRTAGVSPRSLTLVAATVGVLALTSCGATEPTADLVGEAEYAPATLQEAGAVDDVVAATTRIGVKAQSFQSDGAENTVISPASIVMAFSMLAEGANGPAAEELDEWLGASGEDRTLALSALQAAVREFDGEPGIVQDDELPEVPILHLANQVTVRQDGGVTDEFLNTLSRWYDAGVSEADFTSPESKEALDAWVNHHTGGLIEESAIEPDVQTLAVIQNAILLAARWESPFDTLLTRPTEFNGLDGSTVEVDSMAQVLDAQYREMDAGQVIRLPYTEGFAMDILLPTSGTAPEAVSAEDWNAVSQAFQTESMREVDLQVPVLDIETADGASDMLPFLQDQGLESVLAGERLDGIMESDLWIDAVGHQALLQVDEAGTLGAAVTEVEIAETSAPEETEPPVTMHVDRPFTLRVVHLGTEWPLFMATVHDPTA